MSKRAQKLLEKMKRSLGGWGQDDFRTLYRGFGFEEVEGSNHRQYTHPKYPQLKATVGRHQSLAKGYAQTAIQLIEQLQALQERAEKEESGHGET